MTVLNLENNFSNSLNLSFFGRTLKNKKNHSLIRKSCESHWENLSERIKTAIESAVLDLAKDKKGFNATKISRKEFKKEGLDSSIIVLSNGEIFFLVHKDKERENSLGKGHEKVAKILKNNFILCVYRKNRISPKRQMKKILKAIPVFERYRGVKGFVQCYPVRWCSYARKVMQYGILSERYAGTCNDYIMKMHIPDILKLPLAIQVAETLAKMHENDDFHFDVKPQNVFIREILPKEEIENMCAKVGSGNRHEREKALVNPPFQALIADYEGAVSFKGKDEVSLEGVAWTRSYSSVDFHLAKAKNMNFTKQQAIAYDIESFARFLFVFFRFGEIDNIESDYQENISWEEQNDSVFYITNPHFNTDSNPIYKFIWKIGSFINHKGDISPKKPTTMRNIVTELQSLLKESEVIALSKKRYVGIGKFQWLP